MGIWQPLHDVVRKLIEIRQNTRNWYDLLPLSSHYMKLIRFGSPDHEKPGVLLDDGRRIDVSAFGADYD